MTELAWLGERRSNLPVDQVGRPGVPDDAAGIGRAMGRAGRDERVEAIASWIGEDPRVSPGGLAPGSGILDLVPARVRFAQGVAGVLGPCHEVRRRGQADALDAAALRGRGARVERVPRACVEDGGAGPGGDVIPGAGRTRLQGIGQDVPVPQVGGNGVSHGRVAMPQVLVAQRFRCLEVEDVEPGAVVRQPPVPDPTVLESQHASRPDQPFNPVVATPRTNWRWKMMKTTRSGMTMRAA